MLSTTASEETTKYDDLGKFKEPLDARQDAEWKLYRGDANVYDIPVEEGSWESIIPNRAMVEVNRVVEDLSYAARQLYIKIADGDYRNRKMITATEQTANGILYLADLMLQDSPSGSTLQSLLAKYWVIRGWSTLRFILRDEDDKLVPDLAVWDTRNVRWIEGRKRLTWVCNLRYSTKAQVEDEYGSVPGNPDAVSGLYKLYDVWDCSVEGKPAQEGVIIGSEYVKDPEDVKVNNVSLDYLPIHISSRRGMPLIQDDNEDNFKFSGQSYLTNNHNLFVSEAYLLSYIMTSAKKDAKAPLVVEWDSTKGGLSPIEKFQDSDPNVAGRVIALDTAKGEKLSNPMPPSNTGNILQMYGLLRGMLGVGGMNDISFGTLDKALPAQGIDILSHAAMANERAFKNGIEGDFEWLAGEAVRQYKLGDFKEQEFEGYDKSDNKFFAKIKPKQIDENWRFKCKLIPDLLRDKASNIQIYSQAVQSKLMSLQTAMDEGQIVLDPDAEMERIARETAKVALGIDVTEGLVELVKDFASAKGEDKQKAAFMLTYAFQNFQRAMGQGQPGGNGSQPAKQVVNNNQIQPGTVPPEVRAAAQREVV